MGPLVKSAGDFGKGVLSRAYFWFFALFLDPLDWWNNYLKPENWPEYNVSTAAFFYVLGALVLWTSFLTFHDLRVRTQQAVREFDMPLHEALRWIARDSIWAEKYRDSDDNWVSCVVSEFWSKWQLGRFEMVGLDRAGNGGLNYLPPAMKGSAKMDGHRLVDDEPPTHIWCDNVRSPDGMPSCFYNVMLDSREVKRVWPIRSLKGRVLGSSPVERISGYTDIFLKQDAWYINGRKLPETPMEWILNER